MARTNQLLFTLFLALTTGTHAAPQAGVAAPVKVAARAEPTEFEPQTNAGPGGSDFKDSTHFRVYNGGNDATDSLAMLEGAYECFVNVLGWRSSGLSFNPGSDDGPYHKTNVYSVSNLDSAAGVMHSEPESGAGWLEVVHTYLASPGVTVHEYGHALHYHQRTWVNQQRTGAWWETVANWVADTYSTSPLCADARTKHNHPEGRTEFEVNKVIGDSFQVIVDGTVGSGNYYQAWPFFTYLTNNPDNIAGLGKDTLHQLMVQYEQDSNETPLHTLDRVLEGNATAGDVVGSYWARMAYVDIGHEQAQELFNQAKDTVNFANVDESGSGYKVKSDRAPRYMGANIIPLKTSGGKVDVKVTSSGEFTATLAIKGSSEVRYVALANGAGSAEVTSGEEASLVVANTPKTLILYDGFELASSEANKGLDYSFTLTGATVA
ncbi:dockerin type 1 [Colletotrichum incanum]|uniref:Dockerin type 1 n=1 Tax=Colletotrichum incanum TaxID=1573173 RepID=A0A166VBB5_COLIC|nr:dockerin type 1 [Colletotrichum incanum]